MRTSKPLSLALSFLIALAVLSGSIAAPLLCRSFYYAHIGPMGLEGWGLTGEEIRTAYDEMMDFDQRRLLGLITRKGSLDSHTAMLVRAYHIPAIVEVNVTPRCEGRLALMDGYTGSVYIDPEPEQLEQLRELYQANGRPEGSTVVIS